MQAVKRWLPAALVGGVALAVGTMLPSGEVRADTRGASASVPIAPAVLTGDAAANTELVRHRRGFSRGGFGWGARRGFGFHRGFGWGARRGFGFHRGFGVGVGFGRPAFGFHRGFGWGRPMGWGVHRPWGFHGGFHRPGVRVWW